MRYGRSALVAVAEQTERDDEGPWSRLLELLQAGLADSPGASYEGMRARLVRYFKVKGCLEADLLADRTFERLEAKLRTLLPRDIDKPHGYILGVARRVMLETVRTEVTRRRRLERLRGFVEDADADSSRDEELPCLRRCLDEMKPEDRHLLLRYYGGSPRDGTRRELARELGLETNHLRVRMHRLRAQLERRMLELAASRCGAASASDR